MRSSKSISLFLLMFLWITIFFRYFFFKNFLIYSWSSFWISGWGSYTCCCLGFSLFFFLRSFSCSPLSSGSRSSSSASIASFECSDSESLSSLAFYCSLSLPINSSPLTSAPSLLSFSSPFSSCSACSTSDSALPEDWAPSSPASPSSSFLISSRTSRSY